MLRHAPKVMWSFAIAMVLGSINAYGPTPGLASNGVSTLYNLTWLCLNLSFWALALSILVFSGRPGLVASAATSTILVYWFLKLDLDYYRLRFINVGLVNTLGQYHPPMLYAHHLYILYHIITGVNNKARPHIWTVRKGSDLVWLVTVSVLLSSWWANQELFWGNWWNWDPVEMVSLGFILLGAYYSHQTVLGFALKNRGFTTYPVPTHCLLMYLVVRGPLANSVHSFTNSYWMRLDRELFYITIASLVILGCWAWGMAIKTRLTGRPDKRFVWVAAIAYVPIIVSLFIWAGSTLTSTMYINLLTTVGTLTWLSNSPGRVRMPADTAHLAIAILPLTALIVWEPTLNLLITSTSTNRQIGVGLQQLSAWHSRPGMSYKTCLYANPQRLETKHQSVLTACGGGVSKKTYLRPASGIEFYSFSPQTQITQIVAALALLRLRKRARPVLW